METIPRNDFILRHRYDAFCKAVLRNEAKSYWSEMAHRREREKSLDALTQEEMDKLSVVDDYPSDSYVFSSYGYDLLIDNELVAEAFASLPEQEQSILILHCVLDLADGEIGSLMCALPGFVDSKNEEKTERNAGYLVVSHSGGGMLRQGTRKGIRRTPANRGMRAHRIVKSLDISEDVCHGLCP